MQIVTVTITNNTAEAITVGRVTYQPGVAFPLFDKTDITTYGDTLDTVLNHFDEMKYAAVEGRLQFVINGYPLTTTAQFEGLWESMRPMTKEHSVGFLGTSQFYFNLRTKEFCVNDPITGKVFVVPMVEGE